MGSVGNEITGDRRFPGGSRGSELAEGESGVEGDPPTSISELCQSGVISVIGIEDVEVAGNPAALHFTSEAIGRAVGD